MIEQLQNNLYKHLRTVSPNHWFREVYQYAVLPPGKLFRPQLVAAIESDFQGKADLKDDPHSLLASAIEIHHTYTLIHDDLPCMDDDDYRRGRLATHKKFGQWQALLAGDGLLNASYQLLAKIGSPVLLKYFSWCVGAKGLIQGQVLDLSEEMRKEFDILLETHKFKTARLIQASIVGSYLLLEKIDYSFAKKLHRFGYHMGLAFQFLDDLSELSEEVVPSHELKINPWITFPDRSLETLIKSLEYISRISLDLKMNSTRNVISAYFSKMDKLITEDVKRFYDGDLSKVKGLLQQLTTSDALS